MLNNEDEMLAYVSLSLSLFCICMHIMFWSIRASLAISPSLKSEISNMNFENQT